MVVGAKVNKKKMRTPFDVHTTTRRDKNGGGGGHRTRVRKPSAFGSTCLALSSNLTPSYPTGRII